jgi:hypothetical protein
MPTAGRAPRKTPSVLPTDPPLPPSLATDITANSTGDEESKFALLNQTQKGAPQPPTSLTTNRFSSSRPTWATKPGDSARLRDTIRDLQRFLTALPFPLIKITPVVIARIICRLLATQGVMPTNIVGCKRLGEKVLHLTPVSSF